jgi:hypothetical protein
MQIKANHGVFEHIASYLSHLSSGRPGCPEMFLPVSACSANIIQTVVNPPGAPRYHTTQTVGLLKADRITPSLTPGRVFAAHTNTHHTRKGRREMP